MGYSDLGCYGGEITRPTWIAFGKNSFIHAAYNTRCWTTRISLLTGLYHHRSDRDFSNTSLLGEILKPAGYRTWWAGKHHANFNPHDRGFDHFSGFLGGAINFWNPGDRARPGEDAPAWGAVYTYLMRSCQAVPSTQGIFCHGRIYGLEHHLVGAKGRVCGSLFSLFVL